MKTTSEITAFLRKTGITSYLQKPPKNYIALLQEDGNPLGISRAFQSPDGGAPMVLNELLSQYLGVQLGLAQLASSTMEYALEELEKATAEDSRITRLILRGKDVRFTLAKEPPSQKRGTSPNWKDLPDNISIQVFPNDPPVADDDPDTFRTNLALARNAVQTAIDEETKKIEAAQNRKAFLMNSQAELD